ncbi:hypothetical protein RG963_04430 [Methanosarcina sp. Z-7115]|uniref:Mobile element protein n=1 Tax=Methanosarcina baikalica TaxID=3073890 RepID=A0ABU2CZ79_9EURY|nr:hypothetical protein [Methanosarcina sp. Z-7115]MDR7665047.1 hypothetical protein [Methanosarcina sp. Z-7115]
MDTEKTLQKLIEVFSLNEGILFRYPKELRAYPKSVVTYCNFYN